MILQTLDTLLRFRSTDGKNDSFTATLKNSPDDFFVNTIPYTIDELPYIHCGGTISFHVPTSFRCAKLPDYLLIFLSSGNAKFYSDNSSYALPEHSLILLGPQCSFEFQASKTPFTMDFFYIEGNELATYLNLLTGSQTSTYYIEYKYSAFIQNNIYQMVQLLKYPNENNSLFLSKYIRDIVCDIMHLRTNETAGDLPNHVKQCKHLLEEEYMQQLTLDDLQEQLNVNKYRLCRDFSNYLDISPMQFLLKIRIEKSKELLSQTDMTIHEIGECVGIPNTTHFINQFRKHNQVTPLQYRKLSLRTFE